MCQIADNSRRKPGRATNLPPTRSGNAVIGGDGVDQTVTYVTWQPLLLDRSLRRYWPCCSPRNICDRPGRHRDASHDRSDLTSPTEDAPSHGRRARDHRGAPARGHVGLGGGRAHHTREPPGRDLVRPARARLAALGGGPAPCPWRHRHPGCVQPGPEVPRRRPPLTAGPRATRNPAIDRTKHWRVTMRVTRQPGVPGPPVRRSRWCGWPC